MNIIDQIDAEHMAEIEAKRKLPEFSPGDTVRVDVRVSEGTRTRVQVYEGVCIARAGGGLHENFTVRKISYGEGVERTFPFYSPIIEGVEVVRRGKVRRAKLYYLRNRRGKSARIAEATNARAKRLNEEQKAAGLLSKSKKSDAEYKDPLDTSVENTEVLEAAVENQAAVENTEVSQAPNDSADSNQNVADSKEDNQTAADANVEKAEDTKNAEKEGDSAETNQAAADSNDDSQVDASSEVENQADESDSVAAKSDNESDDEKKSDA